MDQRPCERLRLRVLGRGDGDLERGDRGRAIAEERLESGDPRVGGHAGTQRREPIGGLDGAIVLADLDERVGEVRPARPVVRIACQRQLGLRPRRTELVLAEQHPGTGPQRAEVRRVELERAVDRGAGVPVPRRVAGLARRAHRACGLVDQLRDATRGGRPLSPRRGREEGQETDERQESDRRAPEARRGSDHEGSPGSTWRRLRPSYGLGRNGKSGVIPFSFTPTPSPTKFWM